MLARMSSSVRAAETSVLVPFEAMKALQAVGACRAETPILILAVADAALQMFVERSINVFEQYFKERQIASLPITIKASMLTAAVRLAALFWSAGQLLNTLSDKVSFLPIKEVSFCTIPMDLSLKVWGVALAGLAAGCFVVAQINNLRIKLQGTDRLEELEKTDELYQKALKNVTLSWQKPGWELTSQWTSLMQLTACTALACLSTQKLFFASLAALNLLTLIKTTTRDWLQIIRVIDNIRYTYNARFGIDSSLQDKTCAVCQDNSPKKYHFCKSHSYDQSCLIRLFITATEKFAIVGLPMYTELKRNGSLERVVYKVTASESIKPQCALCRGSPSFNTLSIEVYHQYTYRWWESYINWVKPSN